MAFKRVYLRLNCLSPAYTSFTSRPLSQSSFGICHQCQVLSFSTTSVRSLKTGDRNKKRGVSALRRTGPRFPTAASKEPLPQPVLDPSKRSKVSVNPKHGLWQFFDKGKHAFEKPEDVAAHGRSWSVEELRYKSFEDLHCLWWVCVKERNKILTQEYERQRVNAGYGKAEAEERDRTVRMTMRAIKHALTERWYAWEDARKIATNTPELREYITEPPDGDGEGELMKVEEGEGTSFEYLEPEKVPSATKPMQFDGSSTLPDSMLSPTAPRPGPPP